MEKSESFNPFVLYSQPLNTLLQTAGTNNNPALYLYENGARNIVFMLEGLTRLHKNAFDIPKMKKWYERFKEIEDMLGQIDYLSAFIKQFEADKTLDAAAIATMKKKLSKAMQLCNDVLRDKGWFDNKLLKFDRFIEETNFSYDIKYEKKICKAYKAEIDGIVEMMTEIKCKITALETQLHELRRKMRWLSIYPQAFNGLFQFKKSETPPQWAEKYMIPSIVNSPFNKLPALTANVSVIELNYEAFIALSFMIKEFGTLKDKGLQIFVLQDALKMPLTQIKTVLGEKYTSEDTILTTASQLLKTFFEEKVLEKLI